GIKPTHLDGHMYALYQRKDLLQVGADLAEEFKLAYPIPTMSPFLQWRSELKGRKLLFPDEMTSLYSVKGEEKDPSLGAEAYRKWFRGLKPGLHHMAIHPAHDRDGVSSKFFDMNIRLADQRIFGSGKIEAFVNEHKVILTNYRTEAG